MVRGAPLSTTWKPLEGARQVVRDMRSSPFLENIGGIWRLDGYNSGLGDHKCISHGQLLGLLLQQASKTILVQSRDGQPSG